MLDELLTPDTVPWIGVALVALMIAGLVIALVHLIDSMATEKWDGIDWYAIGTTIAVLVIVFLKIQQRGQ